MKKQKNIRLFKNIYLFLQEQIAVAYANRNEYNILS
jgi:nuclear transport factor 2 (NTF2) superfamily protein